ncbi:hypothetical protein [uncultured Mediterranean phage uvMED]|nr:hypothetical protein [uncultured Mediterranean phage uvMED]
MAYTHKIKNGVKVELTADEIVVLESRDAEWKSKALDRALENLREKRNRLLAQTDWMANSDVTMSDDWKTYRQELRDITNGLDTVEKVEAKEFPTKPTGE